MTIQINQASTSNSYTFKPNYSDVLRIAKKITLFAIKAIVLVGLLIWQKELFIAGFILGFFAKCIFRKNMTKAGHKIQEVVKTRPWLFAGIGAVVILISPE